MGSRRLGVAMATCILLSINALASESDFSTGPLIENYGPVAVVPGAAKLPAITKFKVAFDVTARGDDNSLNRKFESAARFLNMHAAVGVDPKNMELAVVVHGPAVLDLTNEQRYGSSNPNAEMIRLLQENGVRFVVCGQSATYQDVGVDDLLPGVEMAVSAMTAHAVLQQSGYTINPF